MENVKWEDMDHEDLSEIICELVRRWNRVHPGEELVVLSLPRIEGPARAHILEEAWRLLHISQDWGETDEKRLRILAENS